MMKYLAVFAILLTASAVFALPQPAGYVNDFANIIPDKAVLEQELRDYERNTTIEIAVVTLESVPENYTLFDYGVELFQKWGIGKKGEDNGILVLIVKNGTVGNRLRIELGYGIQGYITGAESGRILDAALPYYTHGDYPSTVSTILDGLYAQLENYQAGNYKPNDTAGSTLPVIFFIFWVGLLIGIPAASYYFRKCPQCGGRKFECYDTYCVCKNCGKKIKRNSSSGFFWIFAGAGGAGGGFGGGGFGGGGSGGGGAGR